ncbi:MAG TPA: CocE/NonD family hydrolase [Allosphingosinicella sp.]|nr:CocE/NonD family hydrolase [Allosphingosinicella sp.]
MTSPIGKLVRPWSLFLAVALPAAALAQPAAVAQPASVVQPVSFAGGYAGGYGIPGTTFTYTTIRLREPEASLTGRIGQAYNRTDAPDITGLERQGARIRFEAGGLRFDLNRTATGLQGTVQPPGGVPQPAYFAIRPGAVPVEQVARYEGTYALGGGRLLSLARNSYGYNLWYLEMPSGRTGFLFNLSSTDRGGDWIGGPCIFCAGPERLRIRLLPETDAEPGPRIAVTLDGRERTLRRLATYRAEEVSFTSRDGTRLTGTLFLPSRGRRHAAVVVTHGSGATGRNGFNGTIRFIAEAYARRGIAALIYDKRGTGSSTGDWERDGLDDLADDAAAALRFLAGRADIRADRLGLSGASQATWVLPMAASRFPGVRILQMRVGSAPMGVEESERMRLERQMRSDGFPQSEIEQALRIRSMMDDYARTGQNWDSLAAAAEAVKDRLWMTRYIAGLPARDAPDWPWLREAFAVDVRPDLGRFRGSIQMLYSGKDELLDPAEPMAMLRAALRGGAARDVQIEVIPDANHNGLDAVEGTEREFPRLQRYMPGYIDKIVDWAVRRLR